MAEISLFFGTQTGNTEAAAQNIQKEFGGEFKTQTLIEKVPLVRE